MPLRIQCPTCGKAWQIKDEFAGRRIKCPSCAGPIDVPAAGAAPAAIPPMAQPAAGPPPMAIPAAAPQPGSAAILTHIKIAGILNIVAGAMTILLGGGLWVLEIFGLTVISFNKELMADADGPPMGIMIPMFVGLLILSLASGIIQLVAGVRLVQRKPGARKLGLVSGFAGCASLWGCCVWPVSVGVGIYTLVILFREAAQAALSGGPPTA